MSFNVQLKPGDIILFFPDGKRPYMDFYITRVSQKTHIAVMESEGKYIEAGNPGGVQRKPLKDLSLKVVLRGPHSPQEIDRALKMLQTHIGDRYSVLGAIWAGVWRLLGFVEYADKIDRNWDCSEFVLYFLRYGLKMDILDGLAIQSALPDDVEHALVKAAWQIIH